MKIKYSFNKHTLFQNSIKFVLIILSMAITSSCASVRKETLLKDKPETIQFHPPKPERLVLDNGMIIYMIENHELPMITVKAIIKTGSIYDSPDKIGLASITGKLLRTGGTKTFPIKKLDEDLSFHSIQLGSQMGRVSGMANINFMVEHTDLALSIFKDILINPEFEERELQLIKMKILESIRRRNDSPSRVAGMKLTSSLYGKESPYARLATVKTIKGITREDIISFHKKYYTPDRMMIGIEGDFNKKEMLKNIKSLFGSLPSSGTTNPKIAKIDQKHEKMIALNAAGITQSYIRIGQLSINRKNPDLYAFLILNNILGGQSFTSRLFKEVRAKKGLAYGVGSSFSPGDLDVGSFTAYADTKGKTTIETIDAILANIKKMQTELVTDEELAITKESLLNSFIFSFASRYMILSNQMSLEYFGFPDDHMEQFSINIEKVTKDDIMRIANKYLKPDQLKIVVVGNPKDFSKPLSSFGEVTLFNPENYDR